MFLSMVTENSRMKIRSECLVNVCELTKKSRYLHKISCSVSAYQEIDRDPDNVVCSNILVLIVDYLSEESHSLIENFCWKR